MWLLEVWNRGYVVGKGIGGESQQEVFQIAMH